MNPKNSTVRWGDLRRASPVSREFGFNRGLPIDRYYIEQFLADHAPDVRGRVLEIGDAAYTRQFGEARVSHSDVLHVKEGNPEATMVGSLTEAAHIPSDAFDCLILTQTLHLIFDIHDALRTIYRILKPGGVVLATFPGISQISNDEWAEEWCWSFSLAAARRLFAGPFPTSHISAESFGNTTASTAFLNGLAVEEVSRRELDVCDPRFEMLIGVRAVKPAPRG